MTGRRSMKVSGKNTADTTTEEPGQRIPSMALFIVLAK